MGLLKNAAVPFPSPDPATPVLLPAIKDEVTGVAVRFILLSRLPAISETTANVPSEEISTHAGWEKMIFSPDPSA
jgi:hypothetical protein